MQLYEKYRPKTWEQVLGQDKAVKALKTLVADPEFDRGALWIEGQSGQGKTTLARIFAAAKGVSDAMIANVDAHGLTLEVVKSLMVESIRYKSVFGQARIFIVDEAQTMSRAAAQYLLVALEKLQPGAYWIFTSTTEISAAGSQLSFAGLDDRQSNALRSRMLLFTLTSQGLSETFARRAQEIAKIEGLDGQPYSVYLRAVKESRNNLRAVLQAIQRREFVTT